MASIDPAATLNPTSSASVSSGTTKKKKHRAAPSSENTDTTPCEIASHLCICERVCCEEP